MPIFRQAPERVLRSSDDSEAARTLSRSSAANSVFKKPKSDLAIWLAFINENTGQPDKKHDQDLRDTCVMLLDRADNALLSICDVTGQS